MRQASSAAAGSPSSSRSQSRSQPRAAAAAANPDSTLRDLLRREARPPPVAPAHVVEPEEDRHALIGLGRVLQQAVGRPRLERPALAPPGLLAVVALERRQIAGPVPGRQVDVGPHGLAAPHRGHLAQTVEEPAQPGGARVDVVERERVPAHARRAQAAPGQPGHLGRVVAGGDQHGVVVAEVVAGEPEPAHRARAHPDQRQHAAQRPVAGADGDHHRLGARARAAGGVPLGRQIGVAGERGQPSPAVLERPETPRVADDGGG